MDIRDLTFIIKGGGDRIKTGGGVYEKIQRQEGAGSKEKTQSTGLE